MAKISKITIAFALGFLFTLPARAAIDSNLTNRLKGYILLQVEQKGEAWYVNPSDSQRYYMKDGAVAYQMLRDFGLGVSDTDLLKIPVGVETRFKDNDSDQDGLADKLEEGLKTDPNKSDTDGDGVSDGVEVLTNNTNPLGSGKLTFSTALANRLKGKILLQVESRGEAWYVSPKDGKRYYMKNGDAAYQIMRFISLGITDANLSAIPPGKEINIPNSISPNDATQSSIESTTPIPTPKKPLTINDFLSAVVRIDCYRDSERGAEKYSQGSGYLLKFLDSTTGSIRYFAATNRHVVDFTNLVYCGVNAYTDQNELIGMYQTDSPPIITAYNEYVDFALLEIEKKYSYFTGIDLAIIHATFEDIPDLNYTVSLTITPNCQTPVPVGSEVFVIGYPSSGMTNKIKNFLNPYTQKQVTLEIPQQSKILTTGIISGYLTINDALPYTEYFTSAAIDAGNSGGLALAKVDSSLCVLGQPTWVSIGLYANQGIIQNIENIEYRD